MSIHTFGDSHASNIHSGWKDCKNVIAHHLGGVLCFSFGKETLKRCDIRNYNLKDGDTIIFCFGEIDCRNHIHKHITNKNNYKMIIQSIISNYLAAIKLNLKICSTKIKNVCIYNVIPPIRYREEPPNHPFPYLGSDEERKQYVLYFNSLLKNACIENNFIYFDIYDKCSDSEGFLNKELSDGNCHLKDGIHMNEFINKYLL
jgi:hypothetical protein